MEAQKEEAQENPSPPVNRERENSRRAVSTININELRSKLTELQQSNQFYYDRLSSSLMRPATPSSSSWSLSPDNASSYSPLSPHSVGSSRSTSANPSPPWPPSPTDHYLNTHPFTRTPDYSRFHSPSFETIVSNSVSGYTGYQTPTLPMSFAPSYGYPALSNPYPNDCGDSMPAIITIKGAKMVGSKIIYNPSNLIGLGCMGTKVYKGMFEGTRPIAVKRIDLDFCKYFANEVALLNATNGHPNVINYHCTEIEGDYRFIALELCDGSLFDYITQNEKGQRIGIADPIQILNQCTVGLSYIHSKNIVHRDLKPSNILLRKVGESVIAKITDFGLGKTIDEGGMSYTNSGNDTGTQGWKAPEVGPIPEGPRMTAKVDIFALGCIFHYVLTNGVHPFGNLADRTQCQYNIRSGNHINLGIADDTRGATSLIKLMIALNPQSRPPVSAILYHPIFWSDEKILTFFQEVRNLFNTRILDASATISQFESGWQRVFHNRNDLMSVRQQGNWLDSISSEFRNVLMGRRNYDGTKIQDLIKAFRDKYVHYDEIPLRARMEIGGKEHYISYWFRSFPKLLPYTWTIFELLKSIPNFNHSHGSFYAADFNFLPLLLDDGEGN